MTTNTEHFKNIQVWNDTMLKVDLAALKQLINDDTKRELYKLCPGDNNIVSSVLLLVIKSRARGIPKNTVKKIDQLCFGCNNLAPTFIQMLDLLLSNYPELITDTHIKDMNDCSAKPILDLLIKYKVENIDSDDACFICELTHNHQLVTMPCSCKNLIHIQCLNDLVDSNGETCKTCNNNFNCFQKGSQYCYPNINVYMVPLVGTYIIIPDDDINRQLWYAIAYLRVTTVRKLLESITNVQLQAYYDCDHNGIHIKKDKRLRLIDNLCTNLSRHEFRFSFGLIESMLNNSLTEAGII